MFGYTDCPPALTSSMLSRLGSVYGCTAQLPSPAWLRWIPGLIGGLNHAVRTICSTSTDAVAVMTPAYPPFLDAPANNGVRFRKVPLQESRRGNSDLYHSLNLGALNKVLAAPETKLLLWCNPHNPTGRCWTRSELTAVARMCVENDVTICSDEVWGELPLEADKHPFTSFLALLPRPPGTAGDVDAVDSDRGVPGLAERLIVLTSPAKAFNIASLGIATAVIPHAPLYARYRAASDDIAEVSCFGFEATLWAYTDPNCEAWRQRVVEYVRANRAYAVAALNSIAGVRAVVPEASYLIWLDATEALPAGTNALQFFLRAGVGLSGGVPFGGAPGTCRINLACRRETLEEGLVRMAAAIDEAREEQRGREAARHAHGQT